MSEDRCRHGTLVSDTVGEYRCFKCEPIGLKDLAERDARIDELERVVAQLCERNGIIFAPPGGGE